MSTAMRKQRAQSLVELAILLPVLLIIFMLILDLGRGIYYYSVIHNAAREGARWGVIHPDDDDGIRDHIYWYGIGLDKEDEDKVVDEDDFNQIIIEYPSATTIKVSIEYNFEPVTPILTLARFLSDDTSTGNFTSIMLVSSSEMVIER